MRIRTIPYALVANDCREVRQLQRTSNPSSRSQRFNTAQHERSDIIPMVPERTDFTHERPPWTAYGYTLWQPLIARSQNMSESHVTPIPGFLYKDLMQCHAAWVATNRIPECLIEETAQTWKSTKKGKALLPILNGEKKWFIRLDQMSPKDSPFGGNEPSRTFEDVVIKISSSMRAWNCLQSEKTDAERDGREMSITLVLNPWDEGMDSGREFRVFVPPPAARGAEQVTDQMKLSVVSQYSWHNVFSHPYGFTLERAAETVCSGANEMLNLIKFFMEDEMDVTMRKLLVKYGFSFDIALLQLIEVNSFGALSGCGACLLNWVRDGRLMYGLKEGVEFVVTLEVAGDEHS